MADPITYLQIRDALVESGHRYRKELLAMPVIAIEDTLKHMTKRLGIRGKETVGSISNGAKLRPYKTDKGATNTTVLDGRTLETFLGDVVEEFDPYTIYTTLYGESVATERTKLQIVKAIAMEIAKEATSDLIYAIWTGVRDASGNTTTDLFDGFDTIAGKEITAGNIATNKGNLVALGTITAANVGDKLKAFFRACHPLLKREAVKLFVPVVIKEMYEDWYQANVGAIPYNTSFEKNILEGSNKKCEIVDLVGMEESEHLFISTKRNMLVGMDQESDREHVEIRRCDNPKLVQFFMLMFFGVQFESIDARRLCVASFEIAESGSDSGSGSGDGSGSGVGQ